MGELFELRPIKKQEDIFRLFILDIEDTLSRQFAPVYAKNESVFGVTLVPFFEEKIVTIEDALIHPWLMTLEGSIDLHLTGTMVISIKQQVASMVAEILTPRI